MIQNQKQPKLYQKFHKAIVIILQVNWKDGKVESMLVQYPEKYRFQKKYYYADESKDFSLTYEGESVFEEVKE
ncbi:hypothetical protein [Planomicrobium sp. CPCC 101079]|uniref:hypothetical protein n=1 Tax=Planomicrobium sp. CPCC 101079 TaxID=2599618 RepID=UPI0011B3F86D|nr:hypothetical protein [Planomicrobium sp. CPCC 101079]TWT04633.1 hypothetical protein FQV28_08500 [Planomicrobium sp. CPCC 101079]